jgi:hypothetical protein
MKKELLQEIIKDFQDTTWSEVKPRLLEIPLNSGKVVTLSGVRRSGKTFILRDIINKLKKKGISPENILYFNFEDERIDNTTFELDLILQAYRELYPNKDLKDVYFFFDEIQIINNWEKFVRRIDSNISSNIFITGSNSKLLSREIATTLGGRTITYEVYPLSFKEYLQFNNIKPDIVSSAGKAKIISAMRKFLVNGGFPELINFSKEVREKTLQQYFNVMLFTDLIERYEISQTAILKYFCKRLIGATAKEFSINKIYNEIKSQGYKIGKDALYQFQDNVEAIYLVSFLQKYSESVINSEFSQKKVYAIDTGLANALNFKIQDDDGRILENLIYLELIKAGKEVYYYKDKGECDFIIQNNGEIISALQVTSSLNDETVNKREIAGLIEVSKRFDLKKAQIISFEEKSTQKVGDLKIEIIPAYQYILSLQ